MTETRKSYRSYKTKSISDLAQRISNPAFRRFGFAKSDIHIHWKDIVGPVLANSSMPEKLILPRSNDQNNKYSGTLYIKVEGSFAPEMKYLESLVIDRINSYYGFNAVERLVFNHGPVIRQTPQRKYEAPILTDSMENKLQDMLSEVKDDTLRQSLYKVGVELLGSKKDEKVKQTMRFTRRGQGSRSENFDNRR